MALDKDSAVRHLRRSDPVMRAIVKTVGPCDLSPGGRGDHFTTLLRAIVGQQLSSRAAETIWQRFLTLHRNGRSVAAEDVLRFRDAELRATGLSNAKVRYAKALATSVASGELDLKRISRKTDERIITELTAIDGIGRWTAEMFLIFKLGRPDVWAMGDLGLRNAVAKAYRVEPTKENLTTVAEPWRPWRSVASWYLWRTIAPDVHPQRS